MDVEEGPLMAIVWRKAPGSGASRRRGAGVRPSVREVCLVRVTPGEALEIGACVRRAGRAYRVEACDAAGDGCHVYLSVAEDVV
jgi:hypothetical protein